MKNYNDYEKEQNKLLMDFLLKKERDVNLIEFIISSYCNQACEYCYLYKHGKELYPEEAKHFDDILENYQLLINWLDENHFVFDDYDFFSGEFFNLPIWEDLLQITFDHEKERVDKGFKVRDVSIPSNGSFLFEEEHTKKVEEWLERFKSINSSMHISLSVEGPEELEKEERPLKNSKIKNNDTFYKNFFAFRKKHEFSSHPMITRNFVKNYKKNYDWWIDTTIEHEIMQYNSKGERIYCIPMFLEVRDAEQWDEESLKNYHDFLKYVAKKDFQALHNNDINDFAYHYFDNFVNAETGGRYSRVQPYIISFPYLLNNLPCSIQGGPVFRVGDLAYVPCHRTMYPHFIYGHFIKENNKIVGLEAHKPTLAIKIKNLNPNRSVLKCSDCPINFFCMKGCLGSSYEHTNELFCADEKLCDLFYTKYKTIHEIGLEYDLYSWLEKSDISQEGKEFIGNVKSILDKL